VNGTTYWYQLQEVEVGGAMIEYDPPISATPEAGGWGAATSAEASAIGTSNSKPFNVLYPLSLPLLVIGVWLARAAYRRRR